MTSRQFKTQTFSGQAGAKVFAAGERMNQMLLAALDPAVWHAKAEGHVRTIAATTTHMHNVRCKWVRLTAPHLKVPAQLNRARCSIDQARMSLEESALRCMEMLEQIDTEQITTFRRDGWASPWPAGLEMLCYMVSHEAHHRGQICMLAHQLGSPLTTATTSALWNWEKLWKDCGFSDGLGG